MNDTTAMRPAEPDRPTVTAPSTAAPPGSRHPLPAGERPLTARREEGRSA